MRRIMGCLQWETTLYSQNKKPSKHKVRGFFGNDEGSVSLVLAVNSLTADIWQFKTRSQSAFHPNDRDLLVLVCTCSTWQVHQPGKILRQQGSLIVAAMSWDLGWHHCLLFAEVFRQFFLPVVLTLQRGDQIRRSFQMCGGRLQLFQSCNENEANSTTR